MELELARFLGREPSLEQPELERALGKRPSLELELERFLEMELSLEQLELERASGTRP